MLSIVKCKPTKKDPKVWQVTFQYHDMIITGWRWDGCTLQPPTSRGKHGYFTIATPNARLLMKMEEECKVYIRTDDVAAVAEAY